MWNFGIVSEIFGFLLVSGCLISWNSFHMSFLHGSINIWTILLCEIKFSNYPLFQSLSQFEVPFQTPFLQGHLQTGTESSHLLEKRSNSFIQFFQGLHQCEWNFPPVREEWVVLLISWLKQRLRWKSIPEEQKRIKWLRKRWRRSDVWCCKMRACNILTRECLTFNWSHILSKLSFSTFRKTAAFPGDPSTPPRMKIVGKWRFQLGSPKTWKSSSWVLTVASWGSIPVVGLQKMTFLQPQFITCKPPPNPQPTPHVAWLSLNIFAHRTMSSVRVKSSKRN